MRKLVADVMLAKLARWLRLAGVSIEDAPYTDDNKIIRYVRRKKALLLTSDSMLAGRVRKRKFRALLIHEKDLEHQLAFTAEEIGLDISGYPGRICPVCNGRLRMISKKAAAARVKSAAYESHFEFYVCGGCDRVYWHGAHWKVIGKRLKRANGILAKMRKKEKRTGKG